MSFVFIFICQQLVLIVFQILRQKCKLRVVFKRLLYLFYQSSEIEQYKIDIKSC